MSKKAIRVLQVIGKMDRAGAETLIMNIYRNIDRSKVQFDFVVHTNDVSDYDSEIKKLGGNIYHAPQYKIYNRLEYSKFWKDFFKVHKEYKVIHGHIRSCAPIYLKIAKKNNVFTIAHSHNSYNKQFINVFYKILTYNIRNIADYFFGCSTQSVIDGFGKKIYKSKNYEIIKNGIVPSNYKFDKNKSINYKKELGVENKFVVGHVGRFDTQKNHLFLIDVFEQIKKKHKDSVLILVGRGPLEDKIKNYVKSKGLEQDVKFLGVRDDVNNLLMAFDVFVFPSLFEGLPVVMVEAQATGLKCFISDVITDEAVLSDYVVKLSLNDSLETWSDTIIKFGLKYKKKNCEELLKNKGFDIRETARKIENEYIKFSER